MGVVVAAVISAGITGGVILGQSGGDRPERYVDPLFTPTPVPADPCAPPDVIEEFCTFLITPEPEPSPGVIRTDIPPIPFETDLRTDCPGGWDSIGQPGVFSICYPPDEWALTTSVPGQVDAWMAVMDLKSKSHPLHIVVNFSPRGRPPDPTLCESDLVVEGPSPAELDGVMMVTCVTEAHGQRNRYYINEQVVAKGTVTVEIASLLVAPDELPPEAVDVTATLRVQQ